MNSPFGERATAELVGKLRLLTSCELCKKSCRETFFAVVCSHYLCGNCASLHEVGCAKCKTPGKILQAHYLDPISETLLKLKELFCGDQLTRSATNKRKADDDVVSTPSSKIIRSASTPSSEISTTPNIDVVFAKKSRPGDAQGICTPTSARSTDVRMDAISTAMKSAQGTYFGNVISAESIKNSPVIQTNLGNQICSQCAKSNNSSSRITIDSSVQASNSVLTLDVAVFAKPPMSDTGVQTFESMNNSSRPVMVSTEMQTERPFVSVKRYFEIAVQTDSQFEDTHCLELNSENDAKSLTSTQAGSASQTVHAQPISLDMSPIKKIKSCNLSGQKKSQRVLELKKKTEDTLDFSGDDLNQEIGSNTSKTDETLRSEMKDSMDSLDYRTLDLKQAQGKPKDERTQNVCRQSPEPDSLDSLPSEIFNELEKKSGKAPIKKIPCESLQKDTLESFFKSSEEICIPETEPPNKLASPTKTTKLKPVASEGDSPLRFSEKKKTVIMSDEDEPINKPRLEKLNENRNRPLKTNNRIKSQVKSKKSQSKFTKALPSFSSDEDDVEPLPMDTEDMRNLEKEIENLDREMEDSKSGSKANRF